MAIQKRRTVQKSAIEDALLRAQGHVSAEELHLIVRKHLPRISIGTVYRNLKALVEDGKALKVPAPDGRLLFESASERHHHLRCLHCNKVFNCYIDQSEFISIAREAADKSGFLMKDFSVTIEGFCSACEDILKGEVI